MPPPKDDFRQLSYRLHKKHYCEHTIGGEKEQHAKSWLKQDTVGTWYDARMYRLLDPLLAAYPQAAWLTVGDARYGNDAHYIRQKGLKVLATDISDALLKEGKTIGHIDDYRQENAEALSFSDHEFDFVCCKESYHHFPRPMLALYEMLRIARKGVVLIEPNDRFSNMTWFENLLYRIRTKTCTPNKNLRYRFEESGNFVYSLSKREFEKIAVAMNYKAVAFKSISNYYEKGIEYEKATNDSKLFNKVKRRLRLYDLLAKLGMIQPALLSAIILKQEITAPLMLQLEQHGYEVIVLPVNPYMNGNESTNAL